MGEGLLAEISFDNFEDCIGGKLADVFTKNLNSHERKYMGK